MKDIDSLCMGCMNYLYDEDICPKCHQKRGKPQETPFIPKKTIIGSRYIVGESLEMNGEGLSYIGYDKVKGLKVYIREFFPIGLCERAEDFTNVKILPHKKFIFEQQFNRFLKCFRSVARLRNISAFSAVYDMFEENSTAYIIMQWIEGEKLDKFLAKKGGYICWDEAKPMFMPLISALSKMHESGILHLGISPRNVFVNTQDKLILTGFATKDLRKLNSPLEAQLYDGCSALEQYIEIYDLDQSTDVYGFTATLFLALTGEYPNTATKRKKDDKLLMPKDIVRSISDNVISGIASGLRVYPNNRTLSFERLKAELFSSNLTQISVNSSNYNKPEKRIKDTNEPRNKKFVLGLVSCLIAFFVLVLFFFLYWFIMKKGEYQYSSDNQDVDSIESIEESIEEKTKISIPDIYGKNFYELKEIDISELKIEILLMSEEFSEEVEEGCIMYQTPAAGSESYEGAIVAVNVSKGKKTRILPYIKGRTISEAALAVSSAGLVPIESWSQSSEIAEGYVVGYEGHKEGDTLEAGSEVIIIRSLGSNK